MFKESEYSAREYRIKFWKNSKQQYSNPCEEKNIRTEARAPRASVWCINNRLGLIKVNPAQVRAGNKK